MTTKNLIIAILFIINALAAQGQSRHLTDCSFRLNENSNNIFVLNEDNLGCLIEKNNNFILYSYAFWCPPCVKKLPEVVQFCEENNIELYVLLIHNQNLKEMERENKEFKNKNLNVLVLSDTYGKHPRKKYKQFLIKYYLDEQVIDDLSKIIFYSNGELKYVSTWMDGDDVLELKIKPLINK